MKRWVSLAFGVLLAGAGGGARAEAQSPDDGGWLFLPVSASDLGAREEQLAARVEAALGNEGLRLVDPSHASSLGSDARALPEDLVARMVAAVDPAVEDAAFGRRERVVTEVNQLLEQAARYLDALGRNPTASRAVADLALVLARVHAESGDGAAAQATTERLLSLQPTPEPDPSHHTHQILTLLTRSRDALREGGGHGELRVEALDPGSCNVFVNGQLAGPAPLSLRAYRGDYAIRLQCGRAQSRVHLVHLDSGRETVEILVSMESALVEGSPLHLRYPDPATLSDRARADAAALARAAGARGVGLLWLGSEGARLELLDVAEGDARTRSRANVSADDPDAAVRSVVGGGGATASGSSGASRPSEWNWVIGGGLVAGGLAALISPVHTLARQGECTVSPRPGTCAREVTFGPQSITLSVIGLAAIAGGVLWWALQPIHVAVSADPTSARLFIGGRF